MNVGAFDRLLTLVIIFGIGYIIYLKMANKENKFKLINKSYEENDNFFGRIKK